MHHLIARITVVLAIFINLSCHYPTYAMENNESKTDFLTFLPMETLTQIFCTVPEMSLSQLSSESKYLNDYYKKYYGVTLRIQGPRVYDFLHFVEKGIPYGKIKQLVLSGCWKEAGKNEIYHHLFGCLNKITSLKLDNVIQSKEDWIYMATLMPRCLKTLGFDMKNVFDKGTEFKEMSNAFGVEPRVLGHNYNHLGGTIRDKLNFCDHIPLGLETFCWDNFRTDDLSLLTGHRQVLTLELSFAPFSAQNQYHRDFEVKLIKLFKLKSPKNLILKNFNFENLCDRGSLDIKSRLSMFSKIVDELPEHLKVFKIIGHDLNCCGHNDMFIDIIRKLPAGLELFELSNHSNKICYKHHSSKELDLTHLSNLKSIDVVGCCLNPDLVIISDTKVDYLPLSSIGHLAHTLLNGGVVSDACLLNLSSDLFVNIINATKYPGSKINPRTLYKILSILNEDNYKNLDISHVASIVHNLMQQEIVQNDYLRNLPLPIIVKVANIITQNDAGITPQMIYQFASILRERNCKDLNVDIVSFLKTQYQLLEIAYQRGYVFPIGELGNLCYEIAINIKPLFRSDNSGSSSQREVCFRKGISYNSSDCIIRLALFYLDPRMYGDVPKNPILSEDQIIKALDLLTPLANEGNVDAQYYLGVIYSKFPKKMNAIKWFKIAAAQGHEAAQKALDELMK